MRWEKCSKYCNTSKYNEGADLIGSHILAKDIALFERILILITQLFKLI